MINTDNHHIWSDRFNSVYYRIEVLPYALVYLKFNTLAGGVGRFWTPQSPFLEWNRFSFDPNSTDAYELPKSHAVIDRWKYFNCISSLKHILIFNIRHFIAIFVDKAQVSAVVIFTWTPVYQVQMYCNIDICFSSRWLAMVHILMIDFVVFSGYAPYTCYK